MNKTESNEIEWIRTVDCNQSLDKFYTFRTRISESFRCWKRTLELSDITPEVCDSFKQASLKAS